MAGEGCARVIDFFTKNPNLKKKNLGVGSGGGRLVSGSSK